MRQVWDNRTGEMKWTTSPEPESPLDTFRRLHEASCDAWTALGARGITDVGMAFMPDDLVKAAEKADKELEAFFIDCLHP